MKIQKADIEKRIAGIHFVTRDGSTTTTAFVTLDNGFEVVGTSAAVDPAEFDVEVGERVAYKDALEKLFTVFAFLHLESAHQRKNGSFSAALLDLKAGKAVSRTMHGRKATLTLTSDKAHFRVNHDGQTYMGGALSVRDILANDWKAE